MMYPLARVVPQGLLIALITLLVAACGGGGGSSQPPPPNPITLPDAFSFTAIADVEPGSLQESNTVTITGINVAVPVTVSGGEYAIGSGGYTASNGQISAGQSLRLRLQAPSQASADAEMTVTVGDRTASFSLTTLADTTPPTAAMVFPGVHSATDQETLRVRGTAEDDLSAITGVTLLVGQGESVSEFPAQSDDGFATWTAEVTLAPGENSLTVSVTDAADNTEPEAAQVTIYRQAFEMAFPDNDVPIVEARGLVWDEAANRVLILDHDGEQPSGQRSQILAVDLATGKRSYFSRAGVPDEENIITVSFGMALDQPRNRLLVNRYTFDGSVYAIDLVTGQRTVLNSGTVPNDQQPAFQSPRGIAIDPDNPDVAYMASGSEAGNQDLMRLNLETGERESVSSVPNGDPTVFGGDAQLVVKGNTAYVIGNSSRPLIKVDIASGGRELLDPADYPQVPDSNGRVPVGIFAVADKNTLLISDAYGAFLTFDTDTETWDILHRLPPVWLNQYFASGELYMHWDDAQNTLVFVNRNSQGVYLMDLDTFAFVTLSKSGELPDDEDPEGDD